MRLVDQEKCFCYQWHLQRWGWDRKLNDSCVDFVGWQRESPGQFYEWQQPWEQHQQSEEEWASVRETHAATVVPCGGLCGPRQQQLCHCDWHKPSGHCCALGCPRLAAAGSGSESQESQFQFSQPARSSGWFQVNYNVCSHDIHFTRDFDKTEAPPPQKKSK